MPQTASLLDALKSELKAQGKTYIDVAVALDLTEASVKRLFSEQSFSLARLDAVCQMLGLEISDLVQRMHAREKRLNQLTAQQEQEITQDLVLLLVLVCVFNRWTVEDITRMYALSEEECVQKLLHLDRLGIIELHANNRVKLLVSPHFKWVENGPIQRFFREKVGQEYFQTSFQNDGEALIVLNGMLSARSGEEFHRKLERLAKEFEMLNREDATLPFDDRKGFTLVMAMRNWEYGLFRHLLRDAPA